MLEIRWTKLVALAVLAAPAVADSFPPVTDAERTLTEVPGHPGATAAVLFEKAELKLKDVNEVSSRLEVHVRLKILKEEGKEYGEVAVQHSNLYRLKDFEGRTVRSDGTEVPLAADGVFRERSSRSRKTYVTKAAFPAVEAGAILDYRYVLVWDDPFFLEPWYFHDRIPTLLSEITFDKPDRMGLQPWYRQTTDQKIRTEADQSIRGVQIRVWAEGLPPIPEEPHSFPFADLSSRYMIVPTAMVIQGQRVDFFDSWKTICQLFEQYYFYGQARRKDGKAKKKAGQLAAGAKSPRDKVAAVYEFVRDEVRTSHSTGVFLGPDSAADRALADGEGSVAEQAILLQAMLAAVKVKSDLIWTTDRREGRPDLNFPNPWWFDHVLVRVELEGERLFLDPSDRRLALGRLSPYHEGTQALVMHKKKPETITLPARPFDENLRRAVLDLELDVEGRVTGTGSLHLTGHHARRRLRWKDDAEATAEAWREWLTERFKGYDVDAVEVEESVADQEVRVRWGMAQREEEVLGDETSLRPSLPLGPVTQLFTLPASQRLTPVWFSYGDRDVVELTVKWPASWEADLVPDPVDFRHEVGAIVATVEVDEEGRRVAFHRRFDVTASEFAGRDSYAALRNLYQQVEKSDAQDLVLVRR